MSPGSMRFVEMTPQPCWVCAPPPKSSLCRRESWVHLSIRPLQRRHRARTQQVHNRPSTGPGTPTAPPENGQLVSSLWVFAENTDALYLGLFMSFLKNPSTLKQPQNPLADLQGAEVGGGKCPPPVPSGGSQQGVGDPPGGALKGRGQSPCDGG